MSFFIPQGTLHLFIARMHSIFRYLFTVLAICALICCWYYCIHVPVLMFMSNQLNQTHALTNKKDEIRTYKSFDIQQAQYTYQQLKEENEQLLKSKKLMRDNFFINILEIARCADLRIESCTNNAHQHKLNKNESTISLAINGSYKQIMQFFKLIYATNSINCSSLNIRNASQHEYQAHCELILH